MSDDDREDREAILARRRRWIALAIAGAAATASACRAQPCLSYTDAGRPDVGSDASDASPQPCLSPRDVGPYPDVGPDEDAGDAPDGS
ncbi:MAG: hypothetical protein U0234_06405 [Sandaracinus sp.]